MAGIFLLLRHHSECTYGFYATSIVTWGLLFLTFLISFQDSMINLQAIKESQ